MPKINKKLILNLILLSLLFGINNPLISTVIATNYLSPVADTYVDEFNAGSNYGGNNYLEVGNWDAGARRIYLKFDLSSVSEVIRARLFIYTTLHSVTSNLTLHEVSNTVWNEYTLTWNNRPAYSSAILDWQLAVSNGQWLTFDLTSLVQTKKGGMLSLAIVSHSSGDEVKDTGFYAREYSNEERRPHLTIDTEASQLVPEISSPPDKTIFYGTTGNILVWEASDNNPAFYQVSKDGVAIDGGEWDGQSINIDIDGLDLGSYYYELFLNDTDNNYITDEVNVYVLESADLPPIADTYVDEFNAGSNYGGDNYLEVGNWDAGARRIYLKFDLSNIATITRARLFMYTTLHSVTGQLTLHEVSNTAWNEYSITWNTRPSYSSVVLDSQLAVSNGQWLAFDLTSLAQTKKGGLLSLAIVSHSTGDAVKDTGFYAREYSDEEKRPHLTINTEVSQLVPELNSPPDKTIFYGTTGNVLTWEANDNNPAFYNITCNGQLLEEALWDGESITIIIDGLDLGSYIYQLSINDTDNNIITDSVTIIVVFKEHHITYPIADTYVDEFNSGSNYGGGDYLEVGNWDAGARRIYFKFEITPIESISEVKFHVYTTLHSITSNLTLHQVSNTAWNEYTLTWNNRPSYSSTILDWQLAVSNGQWLIFDITSLLQESNGGLISLAIVSHSSGDAVKDTGFYAREYSNEERRPYLNITGTGTYGPEITLLNPENSSYHTNTIPLDFTVNTTTSWIGYSLNNAPNVTITEPTSLTIPEGSHSITVYASDIFGNIDGSSTVWFTVDTAPLINLLYPLNESYSVTQVWLNFTVDQPIDWMGYSLDGKANVTITENLILSSLTEGQHHVIVYANDSSGLMGESNPLWFTIDTIAPIITITNPINTTYTVADVQVNFEINEKTTWIGYSLNGDSNASVDIYDTSFLLEDLHQGSYSLILYSLDLAGNMGSSTCLWFTVDVPPVISILNPLNTTYGITTLWLNFTINEPVAWIGYTLDNAVNVTIEGNTNLIGLIDGPHFVTIYATDSFGNIGVSDTLYFTIDLHPPVITIFSPINTSYSTADITVSFSTDETASWIAYSLDGGKNITVTTSSFDLVGLSIGSHSIIIFASDEFGNTGSAVIEFTILKTTSSSSDSRTSTDDQNGSSPTTPSSASGISGIVLIMSLVFLVFRRYKKFS